MNIRSLGIAVLCLFAFPVAAHAADPVPDAEERAFCKTINTYRAQNGLPALKLSVSLTKASEWMSADMARNDYFDHTDSLGRSFSRRISALRLHRRDARREHRRRHERVGGCDVQPCGRPRPRTARTCSARSYKVIGIGRAYNANTMLGWYWTTDFGGTVDRTIPC